MAATTSRVQRDEQGQTLVEFAFILPLLLLLVVGLIEFGKAFNYWLNLNDLASEGSRWAAVDLVPASPPQHPLATSDPTPDRLKDYIVSRIGSNGLRDLVAPNGSPGQHIRICYVPTETGGGATPTGPVAGDAVMVRVTADYDLGLIGNVVSLFSGDTSGFGTVTLAGTSWTRLEQTPSNAAAVWEECNLSG